MTAILITFLTKLKAIEWISSFLVQRIFDCIDRLNEIFNIEYFFESINTIKMPLYNIKDMIYMVIIGLKRVIVHVCSIRHVHVPSLSLSLLWFCNDQVVIPLRMAGVNTHLYCIYSSTSIILCKGPCSASWYNWTSQAKPSLSFKEENT